MTDRRPERDLWDRELAAAAELVGRARDVTLVAHVQPDADALHRAFVA